MVEGVWQSLAQPLPYGKGGIGRQLGQGVVPGLDSGGVRVRGYEAGFLSYLVRFHHTGVGQIQVDLILVGVIWNGAVLVL